MKKIIIYFMMILLFTFSLSSCGSTNSSSTEKEPFKTTEKEPSKTTDGSSTSVPTYVTVLVNADFSDNFNLYVSNTYADSDGWVCYDVKITKKSDFILRNSFSLHIDKVFSDNSKVSLKDFTVSEFSGEFKKTFFTSMRSGVSLTTLKTVFSVTNLG